MRRSSTRTCRRASATTGPGIAYQELLSAGQTTLLMVLSIVVVFLCLAALYESWSVPVSVLLVVPIGILGASAAVDAARVAERHLLQDRPDHGDPASRRRTRS